MKKKLALFLVSLFVLSSCQNAQPASSGPAVTGVQSQTTTEAKITPTDDDPFSWNYKSDEKTVKAIADGLSAEEALVASPYYIDDTLPLPAYKQFNDLKQKKVEEAVKLTAELKSSADKLADLLPAYRTAFIDFLGVAVEEEPKLGKFSKEVIEQLSLYPAKAAGLKNLYESFKTDDPNAYVNAYFEFQKTITAQEYSNAVTDDFYIILANGAHLSAFSQSLNNANITAAAKEFDVQMEKIGELNDIMGTIKKNNILIAVALLQINTGEYFMAQANLDYINDKLPEIKKQLAGLKADDEFFTDEDLKMLADYTETFSEFTVTMQNIIDKTDKQSLLFLPVEKGTVGFIPAANAGVKESLYGALQSVLDTADAAAAKVENAYTYTKDTAYEYGSAAYKGTKNAVIYVGGEIASAYTDAKQEIADAYHDAKTIISPYTSAAWMGIKEKLNEYQRGIGIGVDLFGALTKSLMEETLGRFYFKKSEEDITKSEIKHLLDVFKNAMKGTSGQEILTNAKKTLEQGEEGIAKGAEYLTSTLAGGEGIMSWGAGILAKLGAGSLTSLGKGIFALSNSSSETEDYVSGVIDIASSFIGGSKSFMKGSKLVGGAAQTGSSVLDTGASWLSKIFTNKKIAANTLKIKAIEETLARGGLGSSVKRGLKTLRNALNGQNGNLQGVLNKAIKTGEDAVNGFKKVISDFSPSTLVKGAKNEMANSIDDLFKKTFSNNLKGLLSAFGAGVGKNPIEWFDNWFGGKVEDELKKMTTGFLNSAILPWLVASFDGVYTGSFTLPQTTTVMPITLTIVGNTAAGSGSYTAVYGGSVKVSTTMELNGTVDDAGIMAGTLTSSSKVGGQIAGGGSAKGTFNGKIEGEIMTVNFSGSGTATVGAYGSSVTTGGAGSGSVTLTKQI